MHGTDTIEGPWSLQVRWVHGTERNLAVLLRDKWTSSEDVIHETIDASFGKLLKRKPLEKLYFT